MKVDKSQAPYYDDFDPSQSYTQIMAVPGRPYQSREVTQAQTMIYHYLKRLSDTLLKEGALVSGMGYRVEPAAESKPLAVTIEAGQIYIGGKILPFAEQTIEIEQTGVQKIGVTLHERVVTEVEDESLLNPIVPGQKGAHRLKQTPTLTVNDPDTPPLYVFEDGVLKVEPAKPQFHEIMEMMARRTFDESGNYRVHGLDLVLEAHDAERAKLTVEAGLAYILGYPVKKPAPVVKYISLPQEGRTVERERKLYLEGQSDLDDVPKFQGQTGYALNHFPVQKVDAVHAIYQQTKAVTRSQTGMQDLLMTQPVVQRVLTIAHEQNGAHNYTEGTDYVVTDSGIQWIVGKKAPNPGATYYVTFTYEKVLTADVDYTTKRLANVWESQADYLILNEQEQMPVAGNTIMIHYTYNLARVDTISLDKEGNLHITAGQPDQERWVQPPVLQDPNLLKLGTVYLSPNPEDGKVGFAKGGAVTRMDMAALEQMYQRVTEVEYNQAVSELDREAMQGEAPTELKGVFSDSFHSPDKGDFAHPDFSVMYSLEDGQIMLPPETLKDQRPALIPGDFHDWNGKVISAPMTERVLVEQPYATRSMLINPYQVFHTMGALKMTPSFDNWVDVDHEVKVSQKPAQVRNFYRWWKYAHLRDRVDDLFKSEIRLDNGQGVETWRGSIGDSTTATQIEKSRQIMNDTISYMRQLEVEFVAENLIPHSDNLELTFDGKRVAITPYETSEKGTKSGSVRANSKGVARGRFTTPADVRTGTREVKLANENTQAVGTFTSIGTKRTVRDTIFKTRITLTIVDPLAQTFQFDQDQILTSVGVYFAGKGLADGTSNQNVVVQIRGTENGYPSNVIYAEKVLTPDEIEASGDAKSETKVTFDDPIFCQANTQYAMVLLSDSPVPSVYVAELGQKDIITKQPVSYQPYLAGLLFSSSNGLAWTAHQNMNMKFKLYAAEFQKEGRVEFEPMPDLGADALLLLADFLTPSNTGCRWEMKLNEGAYLPITSYEDVDLRAPVDTVQLRAIFKADTNMSPLIAVDGFTFIGFLTAMSGSYIGRNVEGFDRLISKVKQVFEAYVPAGSQVTPQFSLDQGQTWISYTDEELISQTTAPSGFMRFVYEKDVADLVATANQNREPNDPIIYGKNFRARINIEANSRVLRPKVRKLMNIMK
ncbi:DUF4815 domain-containing protein [Hazenella sp. IB182357]|uniref:DUF4815 domain-containing protein n=1 Tax=Polycladospora coralii TaxID=2771432 RepID=A0A926NAN2_9BACL|nr:DUF4815 domain-containing protein [Polycladospora coralii]MBD1372582.1 DUF4815 domain-containing protein [Polycladospora coralii]